MLRRGGLWERGFSSQSTNAQADAEGFEDTGLVSLAYMVDKEEKLVTGRVGV